MSRTGGTDATGKMWRGGGPPPRVADRYRIEQLLGRGGMSEVFRALDEASGNHVALKRLACRPEQVARCEPMFEREYRTLASLDHPRIVQVHDWGRDAAGPFYTMELMDGRDMRELAPLPYRDACRYLRDVASSLALLHARRLLHRDVSPRNVRLIGDGHCKLFDFGALATFGVTEDVVGTPPCIPPEAIHGLPLDQRADLYSLGALAYYLLTGSYPYEARRVADLLDAWSVEPLDPSEQRALRTGDRDGIPEGLDRLVMSLLNPDALARPSSAAEVIVRLERIAELEAEPLPDTTSSYLSGARLIGLDEPLSRLHRALESARREHGGSALLRGPSGSGRTRLLGELVIHAQLSDAIVLRADGALHGGPYGVARALVSQLLTTAPELARHTADPSAPILAHLAPALAEQLRATPAELPSGGTGERTFGEWRKRMQSALRGWLTAVAHQRTLVVAVDNLDQADEPSAAMVARLAHEARELPLLVVATTGFEEPTTTAAAISALSAVAEHLTLAPLSEAATQDLAASLFGDVANTARLGTWLHARTGGNPGACHALAEHLVAERVVRYVEGSWVIPHSFSASTLPESAEQATRAQLSRLSPPALQLLEALSIHRKPLPLDRCLALAHTDGLLDVFGPLEELVHEGLIQAGSSTWRFAQESLRQTLVGELSPERKRRLHRVLGEHLLDEPGADAASRLEAGFHLVEAGEEARGADILASTGLELMYDADEMISAAPALEAALTVYRRTGASVYRQSQILGPLAIGGYHTDRRLADEYGDEALRVMGDVIGVPLARRLRPLLGRRLALVSALGVAGLRYLFAGRGGVSGFVETIVMYLVSAASLAGAATICLDAPRARRYAHEIEPLTALGKRHAATLAHDFIGHLAELAEDKRVETTQGMRATVDAVRSGRVIQLPPAAGNLFVGGALYALGAIEGFCDGPQALRIADELEGLGMRLYDMVADQIRANYHASRGESLEADHYRDRVELHAIDTGSGWQAEVWGPSSMINAYLNTRDVMGAKRVAEQLDELSERIPSLAIFARTARGAYLLLRGELQSAIDVLEGVLQSREPQSFIGWTAAVSATARAYNGLERYDRALALTEAAIERLGEADRRFTAFSIRLHVQHARALAGVGRADKAVALLDELIETHEPDEGPMTMGQLHEYRARIALAEGDMVAAEHHIARMRHHYRATANPIMAAIAERVSAELPGAGRSASTGAPAIRSHVQALLDGCEGQALRRDKALQILVTETRTASGYLFVPEGDAVRQVAPSSGPPPSEELVRWVEAELSVLDLTDRSSLKTESTGTHASVSGGARRHLYRLAVPHGGKSRHVAVAVLEAEARVWLPPRPELLEALAVALDAPIERQSSRTA